MLVHHHCCETRAFETCKIGTNIFILLHPCDKNSSILESFSFSRLSINWLIAKINFASATILQWIIFATATILQWINYFAAATILQWINFATATILQWKFFATARISQWNFFATSTILQWINVATDTILQWINFATATILQWINKTFRIQNIYEKNKYILIYIYIYLKYFMKYLEYHLTVLQALEHLLLSSKTNKKWVFQEKIKLCEYRNFFENINKKCLSRKNIVVGVYRKVLETLNSTENIKGPMFLLASC